MPTNLGQKVQALGENGLKMCEEMENRPMLVSDFIQTPVYNAMKEEFQDAYKTGHKLQNK